MPDLYNVIGANRAKMMQDPNGNTRPEILRREVNRSGNQYAVPKTFPINKHGNEAFVDNAGEIGKRAIKMSSKEDETADSVEDDLEDDTPEEPDEMMVRVFKNKLPRSKAFTTDGTGGWF